MKAPMNQSPDITWKSWLGVAMLGFTWGATFMVIEIALRGISPFWLATGRVVFAALLSVIVWGAMGWRLFRGPVPRSAWAVLIGVGALSSTVPFLLISWGQQYVTSGFAGVSMASVALIVLPLAHFTIPGERMTLRKTIGFVIGFLGVVILIGGAVFESTGSALEAPGRFALVAAASCYGISSVLMRLLPPVDPFGLATVLLLVGAVLVLPVALAVEGAPPKVDTQTLWIVAALGLIPTAAANFLRVLVIRTAGPVFMSLTNYLVPIWSVVLGIFVLGEPAPASLWLAMVLILCGVALSQYGALRRLFGRT